jgi:hypothetical protein
MYGISSTAMKRNRRTLAVVTTVLLALALAAPASTAPQSGRARFFKSGQKAKLTLSGKGFNKSGGGLLFNHPGNIATDGERLVMADRNNNRVLVWTTLPDGNVQPDLVLGQKNVKRNNPGDGRGQMNWPVGVAVADDRLIVTDAYNDRLLIWTDFPTRNGQAADLVINLQGMIDPQSPTTPAWPWAVWTDGTKVVAAVTFAAALFVWNSFPTVDDQAPDYFITGKKGSGTDFGTPRTVATDGETYLVVGDHNAFRTKAGNFFWKKFPTRDSNYDFYMENPVGQELMWGGVTTSAGRFILLSAPALSVWSSPPTRSRAPDAIIGRTDMLDGCNDDGFSFFDGDGSGMAITPDDRLYVSLYNGNRIVAYRKMPTDPAQCPDFAIGSPDIDTNTLKTEGFVTNPVPATDGRRLLVTSDFDRTLSVWKKMPRRSGQKADVTVDLGFPAWDNALHDGVFVAAGAQRVAIWNAPPVNGEPPDTVLEGSVGSARFTNLRGVALDDRYLYVADQDRNAIYVWDGLPGPGDDPVVTLNVDSPTRLSSDGDHLVVTRTMANEVSIYRVSELTGGAAAVQLPPAGADWRINLSQAAIASEGALFIADTNLSRVLAWSDIDDALAGADPEVVLGEKSLEDEVPEIGKDKLFWPASVAYVGRRLYVGEFKFSHRLVEFRR